MIHYFSIGVLLGLSAGLAPGPLLTLVFSETLKHGAKAGIKVAMAPLVTDLPIIVLTIFILSTLSGFNWILGIVSLVGGVLVMVMGVQGMRTRGAEVEIDKAASRSLLKGALVNALSPHPYLFWLSVGGPTMTRAGEQGIGAAASFIISFYLLLVGSKVVLAVLAGKSRAVLKGKVYLYTMKVLGLLLCVLACFLFLDGFRLLGVL